MNTAYIFASVMVISSHLNTVCVCQCLQGHEWFFSDVYNTKVAVTVNGSCIPLLSEQDESTENTAADVVLVLDDWIGR